MNLLEKVCKELGVEVGEIWQGNDGFEYCILEDGGLERLEGTAFEDFKDDIGRILTGELRPVWRPKVGEAYYIPDPTYQKEMNRCERLVYCGDLYDEWCFNNNLIYKTKEGAIEAANKMIEAIKE